MAVRIDLWVPNFSAPRSVAQYTLTNGSLHDIITDQLANLTSQIEQNLAEFETGDIVLSARNDDGWWDSTAFTSAALNPTARFPVCLYVDVFVSGSLVFQGDVDPKTVSFDRKIKTVSFTCLGALHRLEQWSAETVRRPTREFSDFGLATSCGTTGSDWYLQDTTKTWYSKDVVNCCLIDANNTIWTIIGLYPSGGIGAGRDGLKINNPIKPPPDWGGTPTTPPPVASYKIRPMVFATRYNLGYLGTVTSGAGYLNDSGASWATNQWVGYYVYDWQGTAFGPITSNTATRLNFASGTPNVTESLYTIRKSNYPNLLESLGPTIANLYITGQTLTTEGDLLHLTAANAIVFEEWGPTGTWVASTQEVAVQFAGAKASNPTLSDHQLWLASAIEQDLYPSDGALMVTPYHRDKTVADLAKLLFAACGGAVKATAIDVPAFSDDVVRYADFAGKSVADALTELAMVSNCTLFCTYSGTTTEGDAPKVTFNFQRRDAGLGTILDLSADGKVLERTDSPTWEQYYPSIVVQGANDTKVQKGSTRPGAGQLQVQSDYMHSYGWLHQVLDRLWDFFGRRRAETAIKVKAELIPMATAGVAAATDTFDRVGDAIADFPGDASQGGHRTNGTGWVNYQGTSSYWSIRQPSLDGNTTQVLRHITNNATNVKNVIYSLDLGATQDRDIQFDFLLNNWGLATLIFWIRLTDLTFVNGVKLVIPCEATPGYEASLQTWVGGSPVEVFILPGALPPTGQWFRIRVQAIGAIVQVKYWYVGDPEPASWNGAVTQAPLSVSNIVLEADYGGDAVTMYLDNFYKVGSPGSAGCGLLSRVSLTGSDEWWVTALSRSLREPAESVDLTLISAVGTEYTPDDFATIDASATPEPPVITAVTADGSNRDVALSWPFLGLQPLLGWQRTVWLATTARPETPMYVSIPYPVTVIAGSPPTFKDHILAGFLTSPGPWYVDYQTVLIDGRLSQPSPAYLFS